MADKEQDNPGKKGVKGVMNALFSKEREAPGSLRILGDELARPLSRLDGGDYALGGLLCVLIGSLTAMGGAGVGAGLYAITEPADDQAASQDVQSAHPYSVIGLGNQAYLLIKTGSDYHLFARDPYDDNNFTYVGQANEALQRIDEIQSALSHGRGALISAHGLSVTVDEGQGNVFRYYQALSDEGRIEGKTAGERYAELAAFWGGAAATIQAQGYGYTEAQREALPDRANGETSIVKGAILGGLVPFGAVLGLWGVGAAGRTQRRTSSIRKNGYDPYRCR